MEGAESGPPLGLVLTTAKAGPGGGGTDEVLSPPQIHWSKAFPQSGLQFPHGCSKSGLKLAVLMVSSPFLNSAGTFIHVLWDQPTERAERQLCGEGPWRRGGEMLRKEEWRSLLK